MEKIILATHNKGKVFEIKKILKDLNIEVVPAYEVIPSSELEKIEESASTLEGNAKIKAEFIYKRLGFPTIADDSGLFVDFLNGDPGVFSARYAGINVKNNAHVKKLLKQLGNITNRKAYFRTVLVLIDQNGKEHIVDGVCEGTISTEEKGNNGFGYDSVFVPNDYKETFAQLNSEEKNKISHRFKALKKLKPLIMEVLDENSNNK